MARFDRVAVRYDRFCETPLGAFVESVEHRLLGELLELRPDDRVIDLGCGTGTFTLWMADIGCQVVGVDESEAMLSKARAKSVGRQSISWILGDLSHLLWPTNTFDAALMQVTLEFVDDPASSLKEAWRVLKPGGRLVLGLIHGSGPWAHHYRLRAQSDPTSVYRGAHFWTLPELTELMGESPARVAAGLYVGPGEFRTADEAWLLETRYRRMRPLADAGFLAVRYDKDASPMKERESIT
ncbi:MAG: class I SAM-dependent methyltransferase [Firmicutes bacterium]|nr:class I SAM-dependent methyltransferase [Bacillota bacterium]